ncbi:MAG: hypothetical protein VB934_09355 [Polyangiaceae bacterium]
MTRTWNANGTFRGVPITIEGPKIADRGAMEELVFDGEFGQKFRVFARSPDTLRRWLTPEVRQVIVNFLGTMHGRGEVCRLSTSARTGCFDWSWAGACST